MANNASNIVQVVNTRYSSHGELAGLSQPIGTEFPNPIIINGLKFSVKIAGDAAGNWYNLYMTNQTGASISVYANGHSFGTEHETAYTHNPALANLASVSGDGAYAYAAATTSSTITLMVSVLSGGVWSWYKSEAHSFDVGTVQHAMLTVTKLL